LIDFLQLRFIRRAYTFADYERVDWLWFEISQPFVRIQTISNTGGRKDDFNKPLPDSIGTDDAGGHHCDHDRKLREQGR